jgi:hypothetical protein
MARMQRIAALGHFLKLPWSAFAQMMSGMARLAEGMRVVAGGGVDRMLTSLGAGDRFDHTTSGAAQAAAGITVKEAEMSDNCGTNDCTIKLVQYTIVSIKRGHERILEHSQKLVLDPMDECGFDTWVIAEYVQRHPIPPGDQQYLRVASEVLDTWIKQPLHYEEKQLHILQEIANRIGPPAIPAEH